MKKATMIILAMLMLSGSAFASGVIGLYSDEYRESCSVDGYGFYPAEMWIWYQPDPYMGMMTASFMVEIPSNVMVVGDYINMDVVAFSIGSLETGYDIAFNYCQYDWVWGNNVSFFVTDATETIMEIVPHPAAYEYEVQMGSCEPPVYDPYPVGAYPHLWINITDGPCEGPVATEQSSWGAIKSLYR